MMTEAWRLSRMKTWLWLLMVVWLGTAPAHADQVEPKGYRESIELAIREFAMRNFEESRALFTRAHALSPSARTLRGLGMTEFELRNYEQAIRYLEEALASKVRPLDADLRAECETLLARADAFVGRYTLDAQPAATSITLDGVNIDLPADRTLLLQVGDHLLELHGSGYQPERLRVRVDGGEVKTLSVRFMRPLEAPPAPETKNDRALRKNPWLWTAVGLVVAGAATGTAVALARKNGGEMQEPYKGNSDVTITAP